jgi:hypothetical protein
VFSITSFFAVNAQNCCGVDRIINISGGTPFNVSFEGGISGNTFGGFFGLKSYSSTTIKNSKEAGTENGLNIAPYLKGSIEVLNANIFRAYITAYYGLGIYGTSLKLGLILSDDLMLTLEPGYSHENKQQMNAGISMRF